jgi:hypothetical protein
MPLVVAVVWGLLAAQFFVQAFLCLVLTCLFLSGLLFSRVRKLNNATAALVSLVQVVLFALLFSFGCWLTSDYIGFDSWNANSIAFAVAFLFSMVYCGVQVPGKILLARMSAWIPYFAEAVNTQPAKERIAYARKISKSKGH